MDVRTFFPCSVGLADDTGAEPLGGDEAKAVAGFKLVGTNNSRNQGGTLQR